MDAPYYNGEPGSLYSERGVGDPVEHAPDQSCVDCGGYVGDGGMTLFWRGGSACGDCVAWRRERGLLDDHRAKAQLIREVA